MKGSSKASRSWLGMIGVAAACTAVCVSPALALVQPAAPAVEATSTLPDGKEIHARYIKAIGGEEAIKGVTSKRNKGVFEIPAQGLKGTIESFQAHGAMYSAMEMMGMKFESGLSGETAWQRNPMTGPTLMEGAERDQLLKECDLQSEVSLDKYYSAVNTIGKAEVEGVECYKVEFTPLNGPKQVRFYEAGSGLLVKMEGEQESQGNVYNVSTMLLDYREIAGIKVPFKMTSSMVGMSSSMTYESIELNTDIPREKFEIPDDVRKLVEKKKTEGAGESGEK
ncbi:MAG: hypothetical protein KF787_02125 [Phycisphaeraceae bacterium]|nr:hypothetical protein [Phycisphaerae bacterium]MBX3391422.1 hypothetical protein [Phycisphaeraceae bacterium]